MAEMSQYFYEAEVDWTGDKDLKLCGGKLPSVAAGAPPEFKGREGNWSPEHLFVASLNSCYSLTLLAIAEFSKVPIISFSSTAKSKLEKVAGSTYQVTEIVVKPRVVIASAMTSRACRVSWKKPRRIVLSPTRSKAQSRSSRKFFISRHKPLPVRLEDLRLLNTF